MSQYRSSDNTCPNCAQPRLTWPVEDMGFNIREDSHTAPNHTSTLTKAQEENPVSRENPVFHSQRSVSRVAHTLTHVRSCNVRLQGLPHLPET